MDRGVLRPDPTSKPCRRLLSSSGVNDVRAIGPNRSDITQKFGVSVPHASADLSLYRELAPSNMHYDGSRKRYLAGDDFKPIFFKPNPDRYLVQLKALADRVISLGDTWIGPTHGPWTGIYHGAGGTGSSRSR